MQPSYLGGIIRSTLWRAASSLL